MYWTTKKHKNPTKARFLIAAPKYLVKLILKVVQAALKLIYTQIENCNFKTQYYSVESSGNRYNKKWNSRNKAILMSTFAFSTLYANILHRKLKEFINFCFNVDDEEIIGITRYDAI